MHDAAVRQPVLAKDGQGIRPCLPRVDHDGFPCSGGQRELLAKDAALDVAGREIVMIVESDLADGENLRLFRELRQSFERPGRGFGGIVRVDADGRVDEIVPAGETERGFEIGRAVTRANGHHTRDAGCTGALNGRVAVRVELLVIQMTVGIDQCHFRRAPTGMSSRKLASTGLPPSTEAATIMPLDVSPRSLRGARLATMTTLRPISDSGA